MKTRKDLLTELQKKLSVSFDNYDLLDLALSHSSLLSENNKIEYNERLEFLGDSVLQLCISEYLFDNYKEKTEGELSKTRALIVCENSLCIVAKTFDLGKYIKMSKGEELTGGRTRISILADAVEAVIAAIYLHKGIAVAKKFIIDNFSALIEKAINNEIFLDYKTKLQEELQKKGHVVIDYNLLGYEGPPHRRIFNIEICVNKKIKGRGTGFTKKEAEQNAAKVALSNLEN